MSTQPEVQIVDSTERAKSVDAEKNLYPQTLDEYPVEFRKEIMDALAKDVNLFD